MLEYELYFDYIVFVILINSFEHIYIGYKGV